MWLNSVQREEPYQGLTSSCTPRESGEAFEGAGQVLHGCRQFVPSGVGLSPATNATPVFSCYRVMPGTLNRLPVQAGGRWGRRQVSMALTPWAAHVLQWPVQKEAIPRGGANPQNWPQFGLESATRLHEAGFASNAVSATTA